MKTTKILRDILGGVGLGMLAGIMTVSAYADDAAPRLMDTIGDRRTEMRAHTVNMRNHKAGWVPYAELVLEYANHAPENVINIQWKKGKKKIGKPFACSAEASVKDYKIATTKKAYPVNLAYFQCKFPDEMAIQKDGNYSLELTYNEPLMGKKHKLGSLQMPIMTIMHGSQNNQIPTFVINRDSFLGLATLEIAPQLHGRQKGARMKSAAIAHHRMLHQDDGRSEHFLMRFWTKFDSKKRPRNITLTCLHNGKRISEGRLGSSRRYDYWTYKGKKDKVNIEWEEQTFNFPRLRTSKSKESNEHGVDWFYTGENPGEYRCVALADGQIMAEMFFDIDDKGEVVRHACDAEVNAFSNVYQIRINEKNTTNVKFNKKARKDGYWGRFKWSKNCPARK